MHKCQKHASSIDNLQEIPAIGIADNPQDSCTSVLSVAQFLYEITQCKMGYMQ